jgi:hypothetical protein
VAPYPVRQMMELIENIAAKQTALARADWPAWCARLEQTLARIADSPVVDYFRALGLNPLSPLRGAAFRPDFAEADATPEGDVRGALARVEDKWGVGPCRRSERGCDEAVFQGMDGGWARSWRPSPKQRAGQAGRSTTASARACGASPRGCRRTAW